MISIQYRDRGPLVAALQVLINRFVRHRMLAVDGLFGPMTKEGVQQGQYRMRLRTTGIVDFPMWRRLNRAGNVETLAVNDIYDYRHDQLTPPGVRGRGWIVMGGMSGGISQVVEEVVRRSPQPGSLTLLRLYGHGGPGVQGVSGGNNRAHDAQGQVICHVNVQGRQLQGRLVYAAESGTGGNVCEVEVRPGEFEYFDRSRYSTIAMDGIANHSAIAQQNFDEVAIALARLRPVFAPFGSVELHGCKVGRGNTGRRFLRRLARLWRVLVSGGIESQAFGFEAASRYEGRVFTAYPNQGNLNSWTSQFRSRRNAVS